VGGVKLWIFACEMTKCAFNVIAKKCRSLVHLLRAGENWENLKYFLSSKHLVNRHSFISSHKTCLPLRGAVKIRKASHKRIHFQVFFSYNIFSKLFLEVFWWHPLNVQIWINVSNVLDDTSRYLWFFSVQGFRQLIKKIQTS